MYQFYRLQLNILLAYLPKLTNLICLRLGISECQEIVERTELDIERDIMEQGTIASKVSDVTNRRIRYLYKLSNGKTRTRRSSMAKGRCCPRGSLSVKGWRHLVRPP